MRRCATTATMHFTMIRNWVGLTGDEAFYDACDRYGIVVWQDFWLANPSDGPDPDDNDLFLRNVRDYVLRIRNHPSIGLYCGRNEGLPPAALDGALKSLTEELNPGLHYIPSSADDNTSGTGTYVVTGHGPYRNEPQKYYFTNPPVKFHSEMGSPNVVDHGQSAADDAGIGHVAAEQRVAHARFHSDRRVSLGSDPELRLGQ